jgi:DNA-binding CsgD family transcriptional regulator
MGVQEIGEPIREELWIPLIRGFHLEAAEGDVLRCFWEGMTEEDTADVLGISKDMVHQHARLLYANVGVKNRTQLAVRIELEISLLRCRAKAPEEAPRKGSSSGHCGHSDSC